MAVIGAPRAVTSSRRHRDTRLPPWLMVVPAVALTIMMVYASSVAGAWYAFTDWSGAGHARFVGLANFREILRTPATVHALTNTLLLTVTFVVLVNASGLVLAVSLNRVLKTRHFLRALFFLPILMSPVAAGYIWSYILSYQGLLNQVLGTLGLGSWERAWTADPTWALWTLVVALVWQFSGLTMVIYLAGLQSIPADLDEASAVDGAGTWFRFRKITVPLLAPSFTIALTLTVIHGLRVFDQVLSLTGGGPDNASQTLATEVWKQTWVNGRFGYGAALALVLTVLVAIVAVGQVLLLRRREARL